jgi:hypothetical protein
MELAFCAKKEVIILAFGGPFTYHLAIRRIVNISVAIL